MKFSIELNDFNQYYIKLGNLVLDRQIAQYLNTSLDKYREILINYNGQRAKNSNEYIFNEEDDAQRAIEFLEPYLVMAELMK